MKSAISTIFRKELARFFGDKRMAFTTILLPGLMIFLMYNFMGSALTEKYSVSDDFAPTVEVVNLPTAVESAAQASKIQFKPIEASAAADAKTRIAEQKLQLLAVFPADFDTTVAAYDASSGSPAPNVELYFNSASTESQAAYSMVIGVLDSYESSMANKFDFNAGGTKYDLATDQDTTGSIFSSMLPLLLMIFLFSGCMAIAPESIAGEKERGTIATLLITPARRSDIAFGKIGALSVIALLSGASSALGTILSLPKLMGSASETISNNVYGFKEYLMLALIILSTVLLLITLISIVSAFARSVKEAQGYVTPMMLVVMMLGITAMFGNGAKAGMGFYMIPLYNSVQSMIGIFSFKAIPAHIAITVISNLLLSGAGVFILTRMFNSERVMFSK
jgi:ABC-type Na+ efflux pump, permease component